MSHGTFTRPLTRRSAVFTASAAPSWFPFSAPHRIDVLFVGGGGGGGNGWTVAGHGGGGGAGGSVKIARGYVMSGPLTITIGVGGGAAVGNGAAGGTGSPTVVGPYNLADYAGVGSGVLTALGGAGGAGDTVGGLGSVGGSSGGSGGLLYPFNPVGQPGLSFGALYPVTNFFLPPPNGVLFPPVYGPAYGAGGGGGAGSGGAAVGGGASYGGAAGGNPSTSAGAAAANTGGGGGGSAPGQSGSSAGGSGIVIISWDE